MFFYIGCVLILVFLYPFFFRFNETDLRRQKRQSMIYEVVVAAILILIIGLRKKTIGIDTSGYVGTFEQYSRISSERFWLRLGGFFDEPGYKLLNRLIGHELGLGYTALFLVCAFVSVAPVAILIHKYSDRPELSWCFYLFFGFYTFCFSTMRQAVATGITVLAFLCIPQKKPIKFVLLVLLAMMFHTTSAIFLPAYWIRRFKINWYNFALFVAAGVAIYILKTPIIAFLNEFSTNYYWTMETGGANQFLFIILMCVSAIFMKEQFEEGNPINSLVYFMVAAGGAMFWMLKYNPTFFRLLNYYHLYSIIFIPNQIKTIKSQAVRWGFTAAYMFVGMYFFYTQILTADIKLIYYEFFWQ